MRAAAATQQLFDEIRVYEGIAERTGNTVERTHVSYSPNCLRSVFMFPCQPFKPLSVSSC